VSNLISNYARFLNGRVFGVDVGTGSIGHAVREGRDFREAASLICAEDTSDLKKRNGLRRQRRTLRNRNYRRKWFARELAQILKLPLLAELPDEPISLRCRALEGKSLSSLELFTALVHLFKRRGYSKVPWANEASFELDAEKKKEQGDINTAITKLQKELRENNCTFPCQLLALRQEQAGASPTEKWGRKLYWPRELLEQEFRAILEAQKEIYPLLQEKADWLLFGDTKKYQTKDGQLFHVFHKATEGRNPGVLGLRWARFDNRDPSLDMFRPYDEQGRPQHVVRKKADAFKKAQWELAVLNLRVIDLATGAKVHPDPASLLRLKEIYDSKHRKKKPAEVKISVTLLEKWADEFSTKYKLLENPTDLVATSSAGRARFNTPTLLTLGQPGTAANFQPLLRRPDESSDDALNRYLREIRHPLVRHRLLLYSNLLKKLVAKYGEPDFVVVEAARKLAEGNKARERRKNRDLANKQERLHALDNLSENREAISRQAVLRYRLWKEANERCPYCQQSIGNKALFTEADIDHIVPHSRVDCNEFYNLTVAHMKCNRELKQDRTPYEAFSNTPLWQGIQDFARDHFTGKKRELFLSPDAESIIEEKADIQHTAYIARAVRHVTLIQLNWLGEDGRDPVIEKQSPSLRFQVTNGQLTSRLRNAWGLNQLLHPQISRERQDAMTPEQRQESREKTAQKNRGDLRHHALDAMVIASTLPWLAHRTHGAKDEAGNVGWWTQDEKKRSKAANPVDLNYLKAKQIIESVEIRPHVSRSQHRQAYNTTLYARKGPDAYVAREVFTGLKPKDLKDLYPREFSHYCRAAWNRYEEEADDIAKELKATKGCLPDTFTRKLCFSHFQYWRATNETEFFWPKEIKIPIRNVRLISLKDDKAVMPASFGTNAFVKRTEFKEVRIHLSTDGKQYVPVFVPWWKKDKEFSNYEGALNRDPVCTIRRGMIVKTLMPISKAGKPGKYRVISTRQDQVKIIPDYLANTPEACLSAELPESGLQPSWETFLRALGYELPHPPSPKSGSTHPGEV
jgi:5-methylcytosine-specific restriction endonuclease McrA